MDNITRAAIVNNRISIKWLMLSATQVEIVEMCAIKPMTSMELAKLKNISVPQASSSLINLKIMKYLDREQHDHKTGGWYYEYFVPPQLLKKLKIGKRVG